MMLEKINVAYAKERGVYDKMDEGDKWLFTVLDQKQVKADYFLFYKIQDRLRMILTRYT